MSHTCFYFPAAEHHRTFNCWYLFPVPLTVGSRGRIGEILRWFALRNAATHPSTNLGGRESNLQPSGRKSNALTTRLPSHRKRMSWSGHPAKFTVTSADRTRPLAIDVNVDGPSQVRMGRRETDEGIEFTYVAVVEGEYFLSVIYADRLHIPGSPFRTKFTRKSPAGFGTHHPCSRAVFTGAGPH